jgi:hypothetical protein
MLFVSSKSKIKTITLPDSITQIDYYCFDGWKNLTSINIPEGVEVIEEWTFRNCSSLANVRLGNNVKTIGDGAFNNCASGMSVNIPASVENLGHMLCNEYAKVRFESSTPPATLTNQTFLWACTFYVPAGSRDAYREKLFCEEEPEIIWNETDDGLKWYISDDGVLTVSGAGDMKNYSYSYENSVVNTPWYDSRNDIKRVVI